MRSPRDSSSLTQVDLRTTGLVQLAVSTEAARGEAQGQGRKLSQAVHDQTNVDGLIYLSAHRPNLCVHLQPRALPGPLTASPVIEVARLADFVDALAALDVTLIASR